MIKKIWLFWDTIEKPLLVDKCIKQIYKLHPDYEINIMNLDNFKKFTGDNLPKNFYSLSIQKKTDWIRCKVVSENGGFWIDSSIYISKPLHEWITPDCDLYCMKHPVCEKQIENWFFYSPKNSTIVNKWLEEYETALNIGQEKYVDMRLKEYNLEKDKDYCGDNYLFHQLALIVVTLNNNFKIVKDNFGYDYQPFVSKYQLINNICIKKNKLNDPLYKFRGTEREIFDSYYSLIGYINPLSIIGELGINTNYFSLLMIVIYIIIFYFIKKK